jgi:hypothetical protein
VQKGFQAETAFHKKGPYAFRSIHLVTCHAQEVYVELGNVHWYLARRLGRVRMKKDPCLLGHFSDLPHGFYRAGFVIGMHHRYQYG